MPSYISMNTGTSPPSFSVEFDATISPSTTELRAVVNSAVFQIQSLKSEMPGFPVRLIKRSHRYLFYRHCYSFLFASLSSLAKSSNIIFVTKNSGDIVVPRFPRGILHVLWHDPVTEAGNSVWNIIVRINVSINNQSYCQHFSVSQSVRYSVFPVILP